MESTHLSCCLYLMTFCLVTTSRWKTLKSLPVSQRVTCRNSLHSREVIICLSWLTLLRLTMEEMMSNEWLTTWRSSEILVWGQQPLLAASGLFSVGHANDGKRLKKGNKGEQDSGNHMIFYLWLNSGMSTVYGEVTDVQKSFFSLFFGDIS